MNCPRAVLGNYQNQEGAQILSGKIRHTKGDPTKVHGSGANLSKQHAKLTWSRTSLRTTPDCVLTNHTAWPLSIGTDVYKGLLVTCL